MEQSKSGFNWKSRKVKGKNGSTFWNFYDGNALRFFEWMRRNEKLKENVTAYRLILRVLGRREDWDAVETMGVVEMGAKWFRMMLEYEVQPNVATYGTLPEENSCIVCQSARVGSTGIPNVGGTIKGEGWVTGENNAGEGWVTDESNAGEGWVKVTPVKGGWLRVRGRVGWVFRDLGY
ncbi:hypothetical protein GQ457_17G019960 [Hibiscus cannabinus]